MVKCNFYGPVIFIFFLLIFKRVKYIANDKEKSKLSSNYKFTFEIYNYKDGCLIRRYIKNVCLDNKTSDFLFDRNIIFDIRYFTYKSKCWTKEKNYRTV